MLWFMLQVRLALMRELMSSTSLIVSLVSLSLKRNISEKYQLLGAHVSSSRRTISSVCLIAASSLPPRKCDTSRVRPSLTRFCRAAISTLFVIVFSSVPLSFRAGGHFVDAPNAYVRQTTKHHGRLYLRIYSPPRINGIANHIKWITIVPFPTSNKKNLHLLKLPHS